MVKLKYLFLIFIFLVSKINAQNHLSFHDCINKIFVGGNLEYLEILSDSSLYSSINSYNDTALFNIKNDSLSIKQHYWLTDQNGTSFQIKFYNYGIKRVSRDTIILEYEAKDFFYNKPIKKKIEFVCLDKLEESTSEFKFLRLDRSSPWTGNRMVIIDSLGKVTFKSDPFSISFDSTKIEKKKNIKGQLSSTEFISFKNLLSKSLISKLPLKRGCPIDGATSNFTIQIGSKTYKSIGCELSWIHARLLNYLYEIDLNKGLRLIQ
ncbi:MAG: hypothetical protein QM737_18890 [Ferruginibacter sp.]